MLSHLNKTVQGCKCTCGKPEFFSSCGRSSKRPREDSKMHTKAQSSQPVSTGALYNPAEGFEDLSMASVTIDARASVWKTRLGREFHRFSVT